MEGLFWSDTGKAKRGVGFRPIPPIPATGWKAPREFPRLEAARMLSIDVETREDDFTNGPGWGRGKGHLVGVAVGTDDGARWYFPMRHEIEPQDNLNPEDVLNWLRVELGRREQPKVGANLLYDIGWLAAEGVPVAGELIDVQFAEALLSEAGRVNLDWLGEKYLGEGKETNTVYKWLADAYGGDPNEKQRANLYRCPPSLVGPYACGDVDLPLRVFDRQAPILREQELTDLFRMECALIPLLVKMRLGGVTVDLVKAERLREELAEREKALQSVLEFDTGLAVNVNAAASIAAAFDAARLPYGRTEAGNPSFTKPFLESVRHPIAEKILEIRKLSKLRGTFVESYILNSHVGGKIFCQFHPLRADDGGTRSGRFSSSDPNLQNIPSRDEELAPLMRGLFIPDPGHKCWRKFDYSQIEYRDLAHYAVGEGADELRAEYNADPRTDYHVRTQNMVERVLRRKVARKPVKTINFGLIYGMGKKKLTFSLGLRPDEAEEFFEGYHAAAPYARATMEATADEVNRLGYITTILGRRSRFDLWEPKKWEEDEFTNALPYDQALNVWGTQIRRASTHKALNRRLQGSAADLMKLAMVQAYHAGIFEATGYPKLTVHDELDFSDPGTRESAEGFRELKRIMETCLPLRVPIIADEEAGPDWGNVAEV